MSEDLYLEQIQRELNVFGLNKTANEVPDGLFKEFANELMVIENTLSKWIAADGKAERFERTDVKEIKRYSGELFNKVKLDKLSKVILSGLFNAVVDIHEQPNGKSDNGNPHFQMIIHNNILLRYLPAIGFPYNNEAYSIKNRLNYWNKVLHNILLETTDLFTIYQGESLNKEYGYWLIKLTVAGEKRLSPFNPTLRFPLNNPMIVPPEPFVSATEGGYITDALKAINPLSRHHEHIPKLVLDAINKAQSTAFIINPIGIQSMEKLVASRRHKIQELKQDAKQLKAELVELFKEKSKHEHNESI